MDGSLTGSGRSTIRLRLVGADFPDGEIPLVHLARITERAQLLATRLARSEEDRGGAGRSPRRIAEGVRLMFVGIEPGSTQLLIAGPVRDPQLDLGRSNEEVIERTFGQLIDGLEASSTGSDLPAGYDDLSRRGLVDVLDALGDAAPDAEVEGQVGARPLKRVRLRPAEASERLQAGGQPAPSPPLVRVDGVLYAVNLRSGRYRVEDDLGSSIELVTSIFTSDHIGPLLGQRVRAEGTGHHDESGRLKEVDATSIAAAEEIDGFDGSRYWQVTDLDMLLRGAEPLRSVDELAIPGLDDEEIALFIDAIRE